MRDYILPIVFLLGAVCCLWPILMSIGAKRRDEAEKKAIRDNLKDWKL